MKNILSLLVIVILCTSSLGCKSKTDDKSNKISSNSSSTSVKMGSDDRSSIDIIKNTNRVNKGEIGEMRKRAMTIISHRYKETNRKPFILLDKDLWEYEFVFTGKKMTKPNQLAGRWIDFNEDMTYDYGFFQDKVGSGIYTFDIETELLLLIDDNGDMKPQEFAGKLFDRTLIMDGNEIYKDNNYNAKLKRINSRPVK